MLHKTLKGRRYVIACFILVISVALLYQLWIAHFYLANFDGDEATSGLMARHVLEGERPIYWYGQRYMGSLEVFICAVFLRIFGTSVLALRLGALFLFAIFLLLHAILVNRFFGKWVSLLSLLVLALPGWHILLYTSRPMGYNPLLVLGTAVLLLASLKVSHFHLHLLRLFLLGIIVGLGLWSHPMFIYYVLAAGLIFFLCAPEWPIMRSKLVSILASLHISSDRGFFLIILASIGFFLLSLYVNILKGRALLPILMLLLFLVVMVLWLFRVSPQRGRRCSEAALLSLGMILGNLPQWIGWLIGGLLPSIPFFPISPSQLGFKVKIVTEHALPVMFGILPLSAVHGSAEPQFVLWHLQPPLLFFFCLWIIIILLALGQFAWRSRETIGSLFALKSLSAEGIKTVALLILLSLPLVMLTLTGVSDNIWGVRYLIISWQASAVVLGLFMEGLLVRYRVVGGVVLVLCVILGFEHVQHATRLWERFELGGTEDRNQIWNSPKVLADLEAYLVANHVRGGYSDWPLAYALDYLWQERIIIAPYNGHDRYPRYSQEVSAMPIQAYIFSSAEEPDRDAELQSLINALRIRSWVGGTYPSIFVRLKEKILLDRKRIGFYTVWLVADSSAKSPSRWIDDQIRPQRNPMKY